MQAHDSLPYYDPPVTDAQQHEIDRLIAKELKATSSTRPKIHPSLSPAADSNDSRTLLQTQSSQDKLNAIDLARYSSLDAPADNKRPSYELAIRQAMIAAEHTRTRLDNLSLTKSYGSNAWLIHNSQLEYSLRLLEQELEQTRAEQTTVNKERKSSQVAAGEQLDRLQRRWRSLIGKVLEVELANEQLKAEIAQLQDQTQI